MSTVGSSPTTNLVGEPGADVRGIARGYRLADDKASLDPDRVVHSPAHAALRAPKRSGLEAVA